MRGTAPLRGRVGGRKSAPVGLSQPRGVGASRRDRRGELDAPTLASEDAAGSPCSPTCSSASARRRAARAAAPPARAAPHVRDRAARGRRNDRRRARLSRPRLGQDHVDLPRLRGQPPRGDRAATRATPPYARRRPRRGLSPDIWRSYRASTGPLGLDSGPTGARLASRPHAPELAQAIGVHAPEAGNNLGAPNRRHRQRASADGHDERCRHDSDSSAGHQPRSVLGFLAPNGPSKPKTELQRIWGTIGEAAVMPSHRPPVTPPRRLASFACA